MGSAVAVIPRQKGHLVTSSEPITLKELFDGGLRPFRLGTLLCDCMILEGDIEVSHPSAGSFALPVQYASFTLDEDYTVGYLSIYGGYMPIPEAAAKMKEICQIFGLSTDGLEAQMATVESRNASLKRWSKNWRSGKATFSFVIDPIAFYDHLSASIEIFANWERPMKIMPLMERIKPPPGYEGVSMDMPAVGSSGLPPYPSKPHVPYVERKNDARPVLSTTPSLEPTPMVAVQSEDSHEGGGLWWLILIILVAAGAACWRMHRKSK